MATQHSTPEESWYEPTLDHRSVSAITPAIGTWLRVGVRAVVYGGLVAGLVAAAVASMLTLGPAAISVAGLGGLFLVLLVGVGVVVSAPYAAARGLARLTLATNRRE